MSKALQKLAWKRQFQWRTLCISDFKNKNTKESKIVTITQNLPQTTTSAYSSPWQAVKDPKGSSLVYYWNSTTNETTALGAPKPAVWLMQTDPKGSGQIYYWNPETQETTALGAPNPNYVSNGKQFQQISQPQTLGGSMITYLGLGLGLGLGVALVRIMIG